MCIRDSFLHPAIRRWFGEQRASGNFVDKADLVTEFEVLAGAYVQAFRLKETEGNLTALEKVRITLLTRLETLQGADWSRKCQANLVQKFLQARLLRPQRVMSLSAPEEKFRVHCA